MRMLGIQQSIDLLLTLCRCRMSVMSSRMEKKVQYIRRQKFSSWYWYDGDCNIRTIHRGPNDFGLIHVITNYPEACCVKNPPLASFI